MTRCKEKLEAPLSQESSCGLVPSIPKVRNMFGITSGSPIMKMILDLINEYYFNYIPS